MRDQEQISAFESEEVPYRRPTLFMRCLTAAASYLSFAASLVALWLNWTIPTHIPSWLPAWLIQLIENNRVATLLLPLLCLFVCYWVLRSMTGDILACPERYLDERQKMLRDQVHRSAYEVLKGACLIVPIVVLLFSLSWSTPAPSPAPVQSSSSMITFKYNMLEHMLPTNLSKKSGEWIIVIPSATSGEWNVLIPSKKSGEWIIVVPSNSAPGSTLTISVTGPGLLNISRSTGTVWLNVSEPNGTVWLNESEPTSFQTISWKRVPAVTPQPESWLRSPTNIGLFFATFLLSLFLMVSALPMSLLACKEND
jgi:hypothetical protein